MRRAAFDTQQCALLADSWRNEANIAAGGMKSDPAVIEAVGAIRLGFNISGGATVYFTLETEVIRNSSQSELAEALYREILSVASPKH